MFLLQENKSHCEFELRLGICFPYEEKKRKVYSVIFFTKQKIRTFYLPMPCTINFSSFFFILCFWWSKFCVNAWRGYHSLQIYLQIEENNANTLSNVRKKEDFLKRRNRFVCLTNINKTCKMRKRKTMKSCFCVNKIFIVLQSVKKTIKTEINFHNNCFLMMNFVACFGDFTQFERKLPQHNHVFCALIIWLIYFTNW